LTRKPRFSQEDHEVQKQSVFSLSARQLAKHDEPRVYDKSGEPREQHRNGQ